jgi:hypothetical protein
MKLPTKENSPERYSSAWRKNNYFDFAYEGKLPRTVFERLAEEQLF